ncbi:EAL domain-containing protein [Hydrogenovibrio sp. 3SP14C1]|uniref:EAL and HDOD domain-containing protein n=1 Tax=Hydrogenovibrio sp. 3SP14C1 TaxID=3038774 RepID=UPI0024159F36|nr:EAL domain-containing protein [Hydrogenovibrio sp. 3SP14C1]MDG4813480.1 EAL domain-containing protein [Hydrogenovibrio sp. 3SP14C1]
METLFIGRQPIFDRSNQVYGYELLFRDGFHPNAAVFEDDHEATATVIHNSMMGLELSDLVGSAKAFINFSESFFEPDVDPCFSSNRIVCEVLETVPVTETTLEGIRRLKQKGFPIALDDFVFKKEFIPFIRLADIIKLDIENVNPNKIPLLVQKIRGVASARTKILIERVETQEVHQICLEAGCDYFQGYYFARPEIVTGQQLSVSKLHLFELLQNLSEPDISLDQLEKIVSKDVGLMHKLVKLAVQHRTPKMPEFDTLRQVLVLFGLKRVQSWASMISLSLSDDVVPEVFNIARTRAIFMRLCAQHEKLSNPESYYLTGMFSLLDVILKKSMEELLVGLALNDAIIQGILKEEGDYGRFLKMVKSFERSDSDDLEEAYRYLYIKSLKESNDTQEVM